MRFLGIFLALFLFIIFSYITESSFLKEAWNKNDVDTTLHPQQIVMGILGEFRKTIAANLWVKTDVYHHVWIEYSKKGWEENSEVIPIDRLITYFDPSYVESYFVGANSLAFGFNKVEESIDFLNEGIKANPDAAKLYFVLGQVYLRKKHDFERAAVNYRKGINVAKKKYLEASENFKSTDNEAEKTKSEDDMTDSFYFFLDNSYMLANTLTLQGKRREALDVINEFLKHFPNNRTMLDLNKRILLEKSWKAHLPPSHINK